MHLPDYQPINQGLEQSGKLNLSNGGFNDDLRASQDVFNLSSSGRLPLVTGTAASENRKFAQIDHFKNDAENLGQNLASSLED